MTMTTTTISLRLLFDLPKELLLIIFQRFLPLSQIKRIYTILIHSSRKSSRQKDDELVLLAPAWKDIFQEILGCNYMKMGREPPKELLDHFFESEFLVNPLTREIIRRWKLTKIKLHKIQSRWFVLKNGNIVYARDGLKIFRLNDCISISVSVSNLVELFDGRFITGNQNGILKIWSLEEIDQAIPIGDEEEEDQVNEEKDYDCRDLDVFDSYAEEDDFCNSYHSRMESISIDSYESMVKHSRYLETVCFPKSKHSPFEALLDEYSEKTETIKKRVRIPFLVPSFWGSFSVSEDNPPGISGLIQLPNGWIVSCCMKGRVVVWDPSSVEDCCLVSFYMPDGGAYLLRHLPYFPPAPACQGQPHGQYFLVMGDDADVPSYRIVDSLFLVHQARLKKLKEVDEEEEEGKDALSRGWMDVATPSVLYDLVPLRDGRRYLTMNENEEVQIWTFSTIWNGPRPRHEVLWVLPRDPSPHGRTLFIRRQYVSDGDIALYEKEKEEGGDLCLMVEEVWFWWRPCLD